MDDVKPRHKSPQVNKVFLNWCEEKYGSNLNGHITKVNGKKHDYLAMKLDHSIQGKLKVYMREYIKELIKAFPGKMSDNIECPWTTRLFNINNENKPLDEYRKDIFHTLVMKCMFLAKRAKPDVLAGISFLSTRVMRSDEED